MVVVFPLPHCSSAVSPARTSADNVAIFAHVIKVTRLLPLLLLLLLLLPPVKLLSAIKRLYKCFAKLHQDAYIPCLHSAGLGAAPVLHDESRFYQRVSEKPLGSMLRNVCLRT